MPPSRATARFREPLRVWPAKAPCRSSRRIIDSRALRVERSADAAASATSLEGRGNWLRRSWNRSMTSRICVKRPRRLPLRSGNGRVGRPLRSSVSCDRPQDWEFVCPSGLEFAVTPRRVCPRARGVQGKTAMTDRVAPKSTLNRALDRLGFKLSRNILGRFRVDRV